MDKNIEEQNKESKDEEKNSESNPEKEEKYLQALEEIHTLNEKFNGVVEEMKELRKKKEPEKEPENPTKKEDNKDDFSKKIDDKFNSFKEETTSKNKERALKRVFSEYKEFNPENDKLGVKRKEFEKALNRLNLSGLSEVDDFMEAFEFAIKGMGISQDKKDDRMYPYSSTTKDNGGKPKSKDDDDIQLSEVELSFASGMGISPERLKERLKERKRS
jgi:hypothetical protein